MQLISIDTNEVEHYQKIHVENPGFSKWYSIYGYVPWAVGG